MCLPRHELEADNDIPFKLIIKSVLDISEILKSKFLIKDKTSQDNQDIKENYCLKIIGDVRKRKKLIKGVGIKKKCFSIKETMTNIEVLTCRKEIESVWRLNK